MTQKSNQSRMGLLITDMWEHHNMTKIYTTTTLQEIQGLKVLNKIIMTEWKLGLNKLPVLEFSHLF